MPLKHTEDQGVPEDQLGHIMSQLTHLRSSVDEIRDRITGIAKDHYTVEEIAQATGRNPYTIRRWIRDGQLNAVRVDGSGPRGRLLVPREELQRIVGDGKGARISPIATNI